VHEQLAWVYAERIIVTAVEYRVAKAVDREHCSLLPYNLTV
jgi:hypothetical protein